MVRRKQAYRRWWDKEGLDRENVRNERLDTSPVIKKEPICPTISQSTVDTAASEQ